MVGHPGCRISTVRDKRTGFVLHRLAGREDKARAAFITEVRATMDGFQENGRPLVGYALVLWDAEGGSFATVRVGEGSTIPSIAMPDFVRNRLLAAKIEEWARQ